MFKDEKTQIKGEITAALLRFSRDLIAWSEENIGKILSQLATPLSPRDPRVIEALQELEEEGVIQWLGDPDIFLTLHPALLEDSPWHRAHPGQSQVLRCLLASKKLAWEA